MKKFAVLMKLGLFALLCLVLTTPQILAADSEKVAQKLVGRLPAEHQRPEYYTGKHGFMNEADLTADNGGPLEAGLYIMSWLVLNPPIKLGAGGGAASLPNDLYNDYFGIPEEEVSAFQKNWPVAGQKSKNPNGQGEDMYWIPINFTDMIEARKTGGHGSGNQFDWTEWGGQGLNQFHEYMFCLVKWNNGGTIQFAAGSDDPEQTWVDGELVCQGTADRNWTADEDKGQFIAPAGGWVAIFAEVGENSGECGYTLEVNPPPDDHTLDTDLFGAVNPREALANTWGNIKLSY